MKSTIDRMKRSAGHGLMLALCLGLLAVPLLADGSADEGTSGSGEPSVVLPDEMLPREGDLATATVLMSADGGQEGNLATATGSMTGEGGQEGATGETASAVASLPPPMPPLEEIYAGAEGKIDLSRNLDTCTWRLATVKSEEIIEPLKSVFEKAISDGRIQIIENKARNAIIARFGASDDVKIREEWADMMRIMDGPVSQVLFEILIVELVLSDINQWGGTLQSLADSVVGGEHLAQTIGMSFSANSMAIENNTIEGLKYFVNNGNRLKALIFSGATKNKVRVLSSPQIVASNHKQATFKLGRTLPILTGTTVSNGVTSYAFENKDIGINIALTPHLNGDSSVGLEINQEVNDLLSYDADKKVADFAHKTLTSSVTLGNGQTVALGGYIQSSDRVNRKSVPGLGDLPLVGRYFNRDLKTVDKVEVIVFITPKILTDNKPLAAGAFRRRIAHPRQERLVDGLERDFVGRSKFYPGHINRRVQQDEKRKAAMAPGRTSGRTSSPKKASTPSKKAGLTAPTPQPSTVGTADGAASPAQGKVAPVTGMASASPPPAGDANAILTDRVKVIEEMRSRLAAQAAGSVAPAVKTNPSGTKVPAKGAATPAKTRAARSPSGASPGSRR